MTPTPVLAALLALACSSGCDPVHDDAVAALGGEAPGVGHGPTHRPGQPCLLCHDGAFRDPPRFTVAGTVFRTPGDRIAVVGATVTVVDARGATIDLETNSAGNFYSTPGQYEPTFPLQVSIRAPGGPVVHMQTLIEGNGTIEPNGACASCHFYPPGPSSPGHVYLTLDDGGTPP
jgi:hypothetical protein